MLKNLQILVPASQVGPHSYAVAPLLHGAGATCLEIQDPLSGQMRPVEANNRPTGGRAKRHSREPITNATTGTAAAPARRLKRSDLCICPLLISFPNSERGKFWAVAESRRYQTLATIFRKYNTAVTRAYHQQSKLMLAARFSCINSYRVKFK